jgi:hypothetical protein
VKSRFTFCALFALAISGCSLSSNSSSNNNPLAGVTIIEATPAPATPTPSPSPTPAPSQTQAIADGGFESGMFSTSAWTACSIPHVAPSSTASPVAAVATPAIGAVVVSASSPPFQVAASPAAATVPAIHSGTYAALTYSGTGAQTTYEPNGTKTGPAGDNGICQTFTLPTSGTLSMYVNEGDSDTGLKYADQEADIVSSTGTVTNLFYELNGAAYQTADAGGVYEERGPYALTAAPYNLTPGQTYTLFIGSYDSEPGAKYGVYMFVDDVSLIGTTTTSSASRHGATQRNRR